MDSGGDAEFAAALASERVRTERYGASFSIISFCVDSGRMGRRRSRLLEMQLRRRLRASDRVGRMHGDRMMVLLPETDEAGAKRVADEVIAALGSRAASVTARVEHHAAEEVAAQPRTGTD
jgi:hypothetical protein